MRGRLYWQLAKCGWRRQTTYRAATIAGMFTNSVFALVQGAVLVATLHAAGRRIGGYDTRDTLTYVWLAQALIGPLAIFGGTEIAERVQTGDIATDFSRPITLQGWWLSSDVGRAASAFVFRATPQFVIGAVIFTLAIPTSPVRWFAFALSVWLAVAVCFSLHFIADLAVFWTISPRGAISSQVLLMLALSGMLLPLGFFPTPVAHVLRALPWAAAVQGPIDVFLGHGNAGFSLLRQALWAVALLSAARAMAAAAHRKLVVQGG